MVGRGIDPQLPGDKSRLAGYFFFLSLLHPPFSTAPKSRAVTPEEQEAEEEEEEAEEEVRLATR